MNSFKALLLEKEEGKVTSSVREIEANRLPEGNVLVSIAYSSVNYKDGLAVMGRPGVVRSYPMIPGVDLAGTVVESESSRFRSGDQVVMTGCGAGEFHWGGYAQLARLRDEWLVHLPEAFTLKQSMAIGTAGYTAMQSLIALEEGGLQPGGREIVVTGAAGGLGSVAVAILAQLGYRVVASTGRESAHEYLKILGAAEIIDRAVLAVPSKRPLDSERWGGAIDSVGGSTLASVLRSMALGTSVAACGLAGGAELETSVFPFILRGVSLIGIDSLRCSLDLKQRIWNRLAKDLPVASLDRTIQTVSLEEIPAVSQQILEGRVRGRTVVDVNA